MAGERLGKTYEALLKVVLDLHTAKQETVSVFWNETPDGLTVEPDFMIGRDRNSPEVIFLVTHCGSSKNSDMKCWRNLGELCEAKEVIHPQPKVISVVFEGAMKTTLKELQAAAFDGQLIVSDTPYGAEIRQFVHKIAASLPAEQEEKANKILHFSQKHPDVNRFLQQLERDINLAIHVEQTPLRELWELERNRTRLPSPQSRTTSVRRGISKLLIFEDIDLALAFYRGQRFAVGQIPAYAYSVGLAGHAIGHAVPCDPEITAAVHMLDDTTIRYLYHSLDDNKLVQSWITQLRHLPNLEYMGQYVRNHFTELCQKDTLYRYILTLHDNPDALVDAESAPEHWPPADTWLVTYLMELIKASTHRANGYGIAQLGADVVAAGYGSARDQSSASQFGGGFLSTWLMRRSSPFRLDLIEGIAAVLAGKLEEIGYDKAVSLISSRAVEKTLINNLIAAKLCTYRIFEPLFLILQRSIPDIQKVSYRTCFAEKAGLSGQTGKTTVALVGHTLINWQTATDAGRDHKRKELCGRAVGLRYTWDTESNSFTKRPGVDKLILLLDGTWRQKDLDALAAAGWDEIYYPDEIDKLKASIV